MKDFHVTVTHDDESNTELAVLRIASASQNSQSQFYPKAVRVNTAALSDLHWKIVSKLRLHQIDSVQVTVSLQLANDKTITFADIDQAMSFDTRITATTSSVSLRWQFLFCADGKEHLHSVYVRVGEKPNPAMLIQRAMSLSSEDLESFDKEAMAPVSCRVDFFDGRFSGELLSVVSEWVAALPKAEPTFGLIRWLDDREALIGSYVVAVTPMIALAASIGLWLHMVPEDKAESLRTALAWAMGTGIAFLMSRHISWILMRAFAKHISRMNAIPVFEITSGDRQRLTKFLAKSHKSTIFAIATAIFYGFLKGMGIWLAALAFAS